MFHIYLRGLEVPDLKMVEIKFDVVFDEGIISYQIVLTGLRIIVPTSHPEIWNFEILKILKVITVRVQTLIKFILLQFVSNHLETQYSCYWG